ncbi:MAG: NADP-dependent oxidoreductase [Bryobacteraceae bacterium]
MKHYGLSLLNRASVPGRYSRGVNQQIVLAARPAGFPKESDFRLVELPMPSPGEGEVLVRVKILSVDPYMRGRMNEARSYAEPVAIGAVMVGQGVGEVVQSRHPDFKTGDTVVGWFGWQQYAVAPASELRKLDPATAPPSTALGVLGMPGLTAYFGMTDICGPKPGETAVISGAAGAVGSIAGQIAKIRGCRAVGIAGSDEKVSHIVNDFCFDAAFNYKTTTDYSAKVKELCPKGVDVYFDNAGGAITDAVMQRLNPLARIAICGQISQYNLEQPEVGPRPFTTLLVRQAKAQGFLVFQFAARYREGLTQLGAWLKEGRLKYREQFADGIENAPKAFIEMLRGANAGKQLVRI